MLGSTFSRKNGSSSRWWVSNSHHEERSQRDMLEKRLILILCMLPGFDCGWEILKRKLCFQTVSTQHPFWLTKTILALKRVKPSGAALFPWMSDRCHHESEKENYRTTKWADRSSNARVGNNYTHSGVSKTNKGNIKDAGTAAQLVRSATKPVLLCTRTHRGSHSRPDYCLDCSVENKPQMTLLSVCNITSILPPSNSDLTS